MRNAFTIDLEEYFHAENLKGRWPPESWGAAPRRAGLVVPRLLDALDRHQVKCTWFVLGWVAEHDPELVRSISSAGHEVGCHAYAHELIYKQDRDAFREDVCRATDILASITGVRPTVFRAPSFSITKESLWALDVIRESGYDIDSSIFPFARSLYGIADATRHPHVLKNGLVEFPLTVLDVAGRAIPVSGGGYARLLPNRLLLWMLRRVNRAGLPVNFYCHPWEFDCDEPRAEVQGIGRRFRHHVGRRSFFPLLERLLGGFSWGTVSQAAEEHLASQ